MIPRRFGLISFTLGVVLLGVFLAREVFAAAILAASLAITVERTLAALRLRRVRPPGTTATPPHSSSVLDMDGVAALCELGFSRREALEAIAASGGASTAERVRLALRAYGAGLAVAQRSAP